MISLLQGFVVYLESNYLVIQAGDIAYEVDISLRSFEIASKAGKTEKVMIWTHLYHREDSFRLFGFADRRERDHFRRLLALPGIGPSLALAVVSSLEEKSFLDAVKHDNQKLITGIPGIGKSKAERMIFEFRKKFAKLLEQSGSAEEFSETELDSEYTDPLLEARMALVALGYEEKEASLWIEQYRREQGVGAGQDGSRVEKGSSEIIRTILKNRFSR